MVEVILLFLFVLMVVTFIVGYKLQKHLSEAEAKLAADVKMLMDKVIFMRTEEHDSIIFAYNAITNDFVCQGKDMDELNKNFGLRFPSSRGVIVKPESSEA